MEHTVSDDNFMRIAIEAAKKCTPEDERVHPKVGVVVVRPGNDPVISFRGQESAGEHAEYTALERHLPNDTIVGATIYTTLEPCTSRKHPKVPCAERLIERKVARVVIGMLDPNPVITGRGIRRLRAASPHFSHY